MAKQNEKLLATDHLKDLVQPRIAIVYTEWNEQIVAAQIEGCKRVAIAFGAEITHEIAVPGSFEIPFACRHLWRQCSQDPEDERPQAIITLGAVIRGNTPHFDYVCQGVTDGIMQLNLILPIPVVFGVMTVNNEQQVWERLGGRHGHKGEEVAISALKMIYMMSTSNEDSPELS